MASEYKESSATTGVTESASASERKDIAPVPTLASVPHHCVLLSHYSSSQVQQVELIDLDDKSVTMCKYPVTWEQRRHGFPSSIFKIVTPSTTVTYNGLQKECENVIQEIELRPGVVVHIGTPRGKTEVFGTQTIPVVGGLDDRVCAGILQDGRRCWYATDPSTYGYNAGRMHYESSIVPKAYLVVGPKPTVTCTAQARLDAAIASSSTELDTASREREIRIELKGKYGTLSMFHELVLPCASVVPL